MIQSISRYHRKAGNPLNNEVKKPSNQQRANKTRQFYFYSQSDATAQKTVNYARNSESKSSTFNICRRRRQSSEIMWTTAVKIYYLPLSISHIRHKHLIQNQLKFWKKIKKMAFRFLINSAKKRAKLREGGWGLQGIFAFSGYDYSKWLIIPDLGTFFPLHSTVI